MLLWFCYTFQTRHASACFQYSALSPTSLSSKPFTLKGIVVCSTLIARCISWGTLWKDLSPVHFWLKPGSPRDFQKYYNSFLFFCYALLFPVCTPANIHIHFLHHEFKNLNISSTHGLFPHWISDNRWDINSFNDWTNTKQLDHKHKVAQLGAEMFQNLRVTSLQESWSNILYWTTLQTLPLQHALESHHHMKWWECLSNLL